VDSALDFTRWGGQPLGVNYRRWVITSNGLRQLFRMKFFRAMLIIAWFSGLLIAATGFVFSQTIAAGGWLETNAAEWGPRALAIVRGITALVLVYPDIVVQGVFTLIFWLHSYVGLFLSLIALTTIVPSLVAQDLRGNALTMYLSRPLTAFDYRIGKLGVVVGVLLAFWTGPLVFGWLLSLLVAPDRLFIVHSLAPMAHALIFNLVALVVLASLAFGVSSLSKSTHVTMLVWIGLWILAGSLARIPHAPGWLRHASFQYNLGQVQRELFAPGEALRRAADELPLLDRNATRFLSGASENVAPAHVPGAWIGLGVLSVAGASVFLRRLRPE
jgi:hypothetical protein